jgi:hypothetical protein
MKSTLKTIINLSILTIIQIFVVLSFSYYVNNYSSSLEDFVETFISAQYVNYLILIFIILIQLKSLLSKVNSTNNKQMVIIIYCLLFLILNYVFFN